MFHCTNNRPRPLCSSCRLTRLTTYITISFWLGRELQGFCRLYRAGMMRNAIRTGHLSSCLSRFSCCSGSNMGDETGDTTCSHASWWVFRRIVSSTCLFRPWFQQNFTNPDQHSAKSITLRLCEKCLLWGLTSKAISFCLFGAYQICPPGVSFSNQTMKLAKHPLQLIHLNRAGERR